MPHKSLTYKIFCDTDFTATDNGTAVMDLQVIDNTSSFKDCLDACALYSFQTPFQLFPNFGCTGVTWRSESFCWLKRNITSSASKESDGEISAMLLFT